MHDPAADYLTLSKRLLTYTLPPPTPPDALVLTSTHPFPLAFKVKTTNQSRYVVRPNVGLLEPSSTATIHIALHAHLGDNLTPPTLGLSKDKFLLCVAPAPNGLDDHFWSSPRTQERSYKLKVQFLAVDAVVPDRPPPSPSAHPPSQRSELSSDDRASADPASPPPTRESSSVPAPAPEPAPAPPSSSPVAPAAPPVQDAPALGPVPVPAASPGKPPLADSPTAVNPPTATSASAPERIVDAIHAVQHAPPAAPLFPPSPPSNELPPVDADALLDDARYDAAMEEVKRLQGLLDHNCLALARLRAELAETKAKTEKTLKDAPVTPISANKVLADPFGGVSVAGFGLMVLLFAVLVNVVLRIS